MGKVTPKTNYRTLLQYYRIYQYNISSTITDQLLAVLHTF